MSDANTNYQNDFKKGHIYLRWHPSYKQLIKMGKAQCPVERESGYITGEVNRGYYIKILRILNRDYSECECLLKHHFIKANYKEGTGGTEFFEKSIYFEIEAALDILNIQYELVNIVDINRKIRINETVKKCYQTITDKLYQKRYEMMMINEGTPPIELEGVVKLRDDVQKDSHNVFKRAFDENQYFQGVYFLATGLGKTYIAFANCLYHLSIYPDHNILWVTYRNDIINSQDNKKILGDKVIKCNDSNFNPAFINRQSGKIIIVLRQSLRTKYELLKDNLFQGFLYDECHDACKVSTKKELLKNDEIVTITEGITYDIMKYLRTHNDFKYFIGYSATPLTTNQKQNAGLYEFYGKHDDLEKLEINYLMKCSLIEGYEKDLLLKPLISYETIVGIRELFDEINKDESDLDELEHIIKQVIEHIQNIIEDGRLFHKKGIIWFPSIKIATFFYEKCSLEGIHTYISHSKITNNHEERFKKRKRNGLMFSCDKFSTGFDCKNFEFGINFKLTETGYITVQKVGRFTRKKEHQDTAFLFQFTDKLDALEIIKCLQRNFEGLGISLDEIERYVKFKEKTDNGNQPPPEIRRMQIFDIQKFDMTIDVMRNLLDFNSSKDDNNDAKIRHLVRKHNDNINESGDLLENLHSGKYIIDMKGIEEFLEKNRLSQYIDEVKYCIDYCFKKELFERIKDSLYNEDTFRIKCNENNININNYIEKTFSDKRFPNLTLINNCYYGNKTFTTVINKNKQSRAHFNRKNKK
jgi:superfamily II DNA or RNA helicase